MNSATRTRAQPRARSLSFPAVAYVGENMLEPLRYYHNTTSNTLILLEAMSAHGVRTLIYSSTCATYGQPEKCQLQKTILRCFNVIGSDPDGFLGEAPPPDLREHGRISCACFDAALGIIQGLKVKGTDYKTADGTCIRDYVDVSDLVDACPYRERYISEGICVSSKKATGIDIHIDYLSSRPGIMLKLTVIHPRSNVNLTGLLRKLTFRRVCKQLGSGRTCIGNTTSHNRSRLADTVSCKNLLK